MAGGVLLLLGEFMTNAFFEDAGPAGCRIPRAFCVVLFKMEFVVIALDLFANHVSKWKGFTPQTVERPKICQNMPSAENDEWGTTSGAWCQP